MAKTHTFHQANWDEVFEDFKRDGVIIVSDIYSPQECDDLVKETVESFKKINPDLDYSDEKVRSTWTKPNLPPQTRSGMFQSMIGHINPVNRVRENPQYKQVFREMYSRIKTNFDGNLIASIDGINIKPNLVRPYHNPLSNKDWAHMDQTIRGDVFKCIQGQMVLSNTTAAFRCSPGSHHVYEKILDELGIDVKDKGNWAKLPAEKYDKCREIIETSGGTFQVPIYAPKGSCILWFSTTLHSAKHSDGPEIPKPEDPWFGWRAVFYITYRPSSEFTHRQKDKIIKNIEANRTMNHWNTKTFPKTTGKGFYPTSNYNVNIQKYINNPELIYTLGI